MAHKVGRALRGADINTGNKRDEGVGYFENLGSGWEETGSDMWGAYTGQVDPNSLQTTQWDAQAWDPSWETTAGQAEFAGAGGAEQWEGFTPAEFADYGGADPYSAALAGTAGQVTGDFGYDASQLGTAPQMQASLLGPAQGYNAQTGTSQGYSALTGQAATGQYQTGAGFQGILGQAMGAA